jgi:hypothetical protein
MKNKSDRKKSVEQIVVAIGKWWLNRFKFDLNVAKPVGFQTVRHRRPQSDS